MNLFQKMLSKITSSVCYDQMMRFTQPLKDHFWINHFWYFQVSYSGYYSYVGTHNDWSEYCFANQLIDYFPCLRHPDTMASGINLMKRTEKREYREVLETARKKFNINFNLQLLNKTSKGVESFGFATFYNQRVSDDQLLNELPLLRYFIKKFRENNPSLFTLLENNEIDLSSYLGPLFIEHKSKFLVPQQRSLFLEKFGLEAFSNLTVREKDILKHLSNGYPSSYIAEKLHLRTKTVENYIALIKCKLACHNKVELIHKAKEFCSIGCFEIDLDSSNY